MSSHPRRSFIRDISLAAFGLQGLAALTGCGGPVGVAFVGLRWLSKTGGQALFPEKWEDRTSGSCRPSTGPWPPGKES